MLVARITTNEIKPTVNPAIAPAPNPSPVELSVVSYPL